MPESDLKRGDLATRMLFRSGNPSPPEAFDSADHFLTYFNQREFRAALALNKPRLHLDGENGNKVRGVSFGAFGKVGFTPIIRAGPVSHYREGVGGDEDGEDGVVHTTLDCTSEGATVVAFIRFKLGPLVGAVARLASGYWPPYASMTIEYKFGLDGSVLVSWDGTLVPNQRYYVDWKTRAEHDMLSCSREEYLQFVEAGGCADAPSYNHVEALSLRDASE